MDKFAEDNEENGCSRYPGPELIGVDNFVAECADEGCDERNDDNTCPPRHVAVDRVDELCADDGIRRGPAYTREDVEECD